MNGWMNKVHIYTELQIHTCTCKTNLLVHVYASHDTCKFKSHDISTCTSFWEGSSKKSCPLPRRELSIFSFSFSHSPSILSHWRLSASVKVCGWVIIKSLYSYIDTVAYTLLGLFDYSKQSIFSLIPEKSLFVIYKKNNW